MSGRPTAVHEAGYAALAAIDHDDGLAAFEEMAAGGDAVEGEVISIRPLC